MVGTTTGRVTFTLNLTGAPSINGFVAVLTYNIKVLKPVSPLDSSNNVLCQGTSNCNPYQLRNCIDGQGGPCLADDTIGVVSMALTLLSSSTTEPTSGKLFSVTFNIIGSGLSEIHLRSATLTNGLSQSAVPSTTSDGYFTNIACPATSSTPCTPPVVDFSYPQGILVQGRIIVFNASAHSTNLQSYSKSENISSYHWFWGDSTVDQQGPNATITHVFAVGNNYTVTVAATDTRGVSASKTKVVSVVNNLIDLAVDSATADDDAGIIPGTVVTITARVLNNGTKTKDANFTISVEGLVIANTTFSQMTPHSRQTLVAKWKTDNYKPRVYRIDAFVDYVRDPTNHTKIIEDILTNNVLHVFVQLVTPLPAGLGLSLLPSAGISVLVLVGAGFAGSRFFRKKPLDTSLP